jgi:hypothetical protein
MLPETIAQRQALLWAILFYSLKGYRGAYCRSIIIAIVPT